MIHPKQIRTRFAPSPTGMMHIGNLRTALYEFLVARSENGKFILRIEDTDRGRLVEGSVDVIFRTLKDVGLSHDEGPDIGGGFGPYIQSMRKDIYAPYAHQLVKEGKAYYCFCTRERLDSLRNASSDPDISNAGYDRHCRNLTSSDIQTRIDSCEPFVIRQKMPLSGHTTFTDAVFGEITVDNNELEDQILLKSDGFPTYNFANVIDDHLMDITHVVRGSEYLSSTPKYNLLYEAFGWEIPEYVHLPLIMGRNEDGSVSKLSKRHGATGFDDLVRDGYLKEAIINYIALLGWCPADNTEIMSVRDMISKFRISGISKSPAVFDYDKLRWFNSEYIKSLPHEDFCEMIRNYLESVNTSGTLNTSMIAELIQTRISQLTEVPEMISFFRDLPEYSTDLFEHKKMKTTQQLSLLHLQEILPSLESLNDWSLTSIHDFLISYALKKEIKNGQIMWPIRTALSGQPSSPGGAVELMHILGKSESVRRIEKAIILLDNTIAE